MTETERIISKLSDAGVTLRVENDRLRYSSSPGRYTAELRELVASHRDELTEFLRWDDLRASNALAAVIRLTASTGQESGLTRVLAVYRELAERWYESRDRRLYEVAEGARAVIQRWKEEAGRWHLPNANARRHG